MSAKDIRIDGWKGIATFLGKDVRTAKRWEQSRALPVYRLPGARSGVFAFEHELRAWMLGEPVSKDVNVSPVQDVPEQRPSEILHWVYRNSSWLLLATAAVVTICAVGARYRHRSKPPQTRVPVINSQAEEFYLKGEYYWSQRDPTSLALAIQSLSRAIALDPKSAKSFAGLASAYDLMPQYASSSKSTAFPAAINAARRAIAIDPNLPEAHRALAFASLYWSWDTHLAEDEYRKAISLDPRDSLTHHWYATGLLLLGKAEQAKLEIETARRLDPTSDALLADKGVIEAVTGDHQKGVNELRELELLKPRLISVHRYLESIYFDDQNFSAVLDELQRIAAISSSPEDTSLAAAAKSGWKAGGRQSMLRKLMGVNEQRYRQGGDTGYELARLEAARGYKAEAIKHLRSAFNSHDYMVLTIAHGNFEKPLGGNPDFEDLKRQVLETMR